MNEVLLILSFCFFLDPLLVATELFFQPLIFELEFYLEKSSLQKLNFNFEQVFLIKYKVKD